MRAIKTALLNIIGNNETNFIVPPFQRVYSWTARECKDLIADTIASGKSGKPHFMGTLLYSASKPDENGIQTLQIVDGQQRTTTVTLMLCALASVLAKGTEEDKSKSKEVMEKYLLDDTKAKPKLSLTSIDTDMLGFLIGVQDEPADRAERLFDNFTLFKEEMSDPGFSADQFWDGISNLEVIAISLGADDSPQEVFESLNSKGKQLAIEDLIRNAMLLDSNDGASSKEVYTQLWVPLEAKVDAFGKSSMDDVICAWIASRHPNEHIVSTGEVYPLFKDDFADDFDGNRIRLLEELDSYVDQLVESDQFHRDQMTEMKRWIQGKPRKLISELKMFGD